LVYFVIWNSKIEVTALENVWRILDRFPTHEKERERGGAAVVELKKCCFMGRKRKKKLTISQYGICRRLFEYYFNILLSLVLSRWEKNV